MQSIPTHPNHQTHHDCIPERHLHGHSRNIGRTTICVAFYKRMPNRSVAGMVYRLTECSPRGHAHFTGTIRTTTAPFQSKRNLEAGRDLFLRLRIRCQQVDLSRLARHPARSRFYKPWKGEVDLGKGLSGRRWPQIWRQPDLWDPVHDPEAKLRHLPNAPSLSRQAAEYDTIAEADRLPRGEIQLDGLRQSNDHSGDGNAQRRLSG